MQLHETIPKPEIALKAISYNAALSQETNAYSAQLWVNGERFGTVSNAGHGGCDDFLGHGDRDHRDLEFLNKVIARTFEPWKVGEAGEDERRPMDLEILCGELVDDYLTAREMTAKMRKACLYRDQGAIYSIPLKGRSVAAAAEIVKGKRPEAVILNTLPADQALAIWKVCAQ